MNRLFQRTFLNLRAMTLTELLVATILVGIVMVGIVSLDYSIRRARRSISESSLSSMEASTAMLQLTRDAMRAIGDITDPGVVFDDTPNVTNICFRHDVNTPQDYTDDTWVCYSQDATNEIYRCTHDGAGNPLIVPLALAADAECYKNTITPNMILDSAQNGFFTIIADGDIEFLLESRPDPDGAVHLITNPRYELQTRIRPPGISSN